MYRTKRRAGGGGQQRAATISQYCAALLFILPRAAARFRPLPFVAARAPLCTVHPPNSKLSIPYNFKVA
jgi:hypothetical protein